MARQAPLALDEITARLDVYLDVEFSWLKTERVAPTLAAISREEQEFILNWVRRIASINVQLAYAFINQAVAVLDRMDRETIESWALHAMDTYDVSGLKAALDVVRTADEFVVFAAASARSARPSTMSRACCCASCTASRGAS
jgi:nitric oxide reductase NorD protein